MREVVLLLGLLLAFIPALGVDVPPLVNYQGRLLDAGVPTDAIISMTFKIFQAPTGGATVWEETQNVQVTKGIFNVLLGSVNPLTDTVFSDSDRWLEVEVAGAVMSPRQRIASAAYAIKAGPSGQDEHSCPPEMVSAGSYCIDLNESVVVKTWFEAISACQLSQKRLCSAAEWQGACLANLPGLLNISGNNEWIDQVFPAFDALVFRTCGDNGVPWEAKPYNDQVKYRCCQ